ncbi:uncharacterized protein I206_100346 [Kwoniella pini CBS 10737]|uniref:Zn(2)-C6 fungal-type domain-containing protein n=1 Tax=Kwoniella pini CBS 10737 TaxID=1296096 RepID=A0AAJ8KX45_9TREE
MNQYPYPPPSSSQSGEYQQQLLGYQENASTSTSNSNSNSNRLYLNQNNEMQRIYSEGYDSSDFENSNMSSNLNIPNAESSGSSGKRKKKEKSGIVDERMKKTRQSPCRARKVKCDRPPPGTSTPSAPHRDICSHCEHLGLTCTFDYKPKKRGPPNMYMRKVQGESGDSPPPGDRTPERPTAPTLSTLTPGMPDLAYPALAKPEPSRERSEVKEWVPTLSNAQAPIAPSHYPAPHLLPPHPHPHGHHLLYPSYADISRSATSSPEPHLHTRQYPQPLHALPPAPNQSYNNPNPNPAGVNYNTPPQNSASSYPTPLTNSPGYLPTNQSKPLYMYVEHPYNPNNPLEQVLPRNLLYEIIDLYFDYIYCLIPCLHRPSFTHDLNIKREERANEEEWTMMVLAIVASTLVQLPRSFVNMTRKQVKELILRCNDRLMNYMISDFENITVNRTIIFYHSIFIVRMIGGISRSKGIFGATHAYLLAQKAHEEKTYSLLNPMDRILLRRTFWLLYGADVSLASIEACPVFFHEDDCADVASPEEIDDEYISEQGYLPQPDGYTPILSGFNYISRLHRITGQVLDKHRRDKRHPPSGLMLQMRLNEVNELYEKTMTLMDNCPKSLRLEYRTGTKSVQSLSPGWNTKAKNDIMAIFTDPTCDTEILKNHFLVQQANIYVTQQQVRFMILQYRDELHELQVDQEKNNQTSNFNKSDNVQQNRQTTADNPSVNIEPRIKTNSVETNEQGLQKTEEVLVTSSAEKDEVICDLLAILQKIPLKVLAINSLPIVMKVQFVASTLLDAIDTSGPNGQPQFGISMIPTVMETRAQKAQRNLWQFLNILSEIEALYSLEDD